MSFEDTIKAHLIDEDDLSRMLSRMAMQIIEYFDPELNPSETFGLIGMQRRGVFLARRLRDLIAEEEGVEIPVGVLDANMYRDDFRVRLRQPEIRMTDILFDINERHLILIDDVLYTGRTIRSALDALMDIGRPASVRCLVVVDRGLQELPIKPDIVGRTVPTIPGEEVRVRLSEIDEKDGVWLVNGPNGSTT